MPNSQLVMRRFFIIIEAKQGSDMDRLCVNYTNLDEIDWKAVLFHAAKRNFFFIPIQFYQADLDLNITDDEGKTPLFYANKNHSIDFLYQLIDCDVEFELDEIDGKAVLFYAAKYNCIDIATKLHDMGLDLNITDDEGKTAVFHANHNDSMDVLCELIGCGAEFNLNEINGYDVLFYAAENGYDEVVKPMKKSGLDLNKTDKHGKTAAFHGDEDFLNALMEAGDISIYARDTYGRTPLFYAVQHDTTKAQHLIEKGANLQSKDNCNASIFTFFIETYISTNLEAIDLSTTQLFQEEPHRKALIHAIFNILYCQAPLLSLRSFPHLLKPYAIFNETNVLEALAFAREEYVNQDSHKVENIDKVVQMIKEKVTECTAYYIIAYQPWR